MLDAEDLVLVTVPFVEMPRTSLMPVHELSSNRELGRSFPFPTRVDVAVFEDLLDLLFERVLVLDFVMSKPVVRGARSVFELALQPFSVFRLRVDVPRREPNLLVCVLLRVLERNVWALDGFDSCDGIVAKEILAELPPASCRSPVAVHRNGTDDITALDDAVVGAVVFDEIPNLELTGMLYALSDLDRRRRRLGPVISHISIRQNPFDVAFELFLMTGLFITESEEGRVRLLGELLLDPVRVLLLVRDATRREPVVAVHVPFGGVDGNVRAFHLLVAHHPASTKAL